jgi:hypothetical protein
MENDSAAPPHLTMSQWVIYDHPRDYPDQFVLRRWDITGSILVATDEMALAKTLPEIRAKIPRDLYCLERFADDDPCIVEVWL